MADYSWATKSPLSEEGSAAALLPLPRSQISVLPQHPKRRQASRFWARKSAPKTRSGCIVCKKRRLKCSEEKPQCRRCKSAGWRCEYGEPLKPQNQDYPWKDSMSLYIAEHVGESVEDRELIGIFQLMTDNEPRYAAWGTVGWSHSTLQLAVTYPSVRQSLCAVGALYKAFLQGEHLSHGSQEIMETPSTRLVLLRYNRAVRAVSKDLSHKSQVSPQPVLVCCALFIWLELMQNNVEMGIAHLLSGLEVISRFSQQPRALQLDPSILHLFMRLQIQLAAYGRPPSEASSTNSRRSMEAHFTPITDLFLGVRDQRSILHDKLLEALQLSRKQQVLQRLGYAEADILLALHYQRDTLLVDFAQLQPWLFDTDPEDLGMLLLNSYHLFAKVFLETLFTETETVYDNYAIEFETLVRQSHRLLLSQERNSLTVTLTFDQGVIPILFFVCLKCRIPSTRQSALSLLRSAPEREGMWHRDSILAAASFKMAMEAASQTRICREIVSDAMNADQTATVRFYSESRKEMIVADIHGLVARLGGLL
ncbi:hypothetical protein F4860DRAFT_31972 [Xylaria cubensis]|nr:hypothetical protein F4860DRAFT_31972 [Xylaria cubensis]